MNWSDHRASDEENDGNDALDALSVFQLDHQSGIIGEAHRSDDGRDESP